MKMFPRNGADFLTQYVTNHNLILYFIEFWFFFKLEKTFEIWYLNIHIEIYKHNLNKLNHK